AVRACTDPRRVAIVLAQAGAGQPLDLGRAEPEDVVLLAAGSLVRGDWLAVLQHAVRSRPGVAAAGPMVSDAAGAILAAGLAWRRAAAELVPRYAGRSCEDGAAGVAVPVTALPLDCVYLSRDALERAGAGLPVAALFERFWELGLEVRYEPAARVERTAAAPERLAPAVRRRPRGAGLPIVYVTESTIVGGGHRDVFEHLNRLAGRGHDVSLYTLGEPPRWFDLRVPVRTFAGYDELVAALAPLDAIKVATWWATAGPVWRASAARGIPVYFVQDIETSYYPDDELARFNVLASYREEFAYVTISGWNRERLDQLGLAPALIAPGVDDATFHPRPGVRREEDVVLALGRSLPLKRLGLTLAAWRALPPPRPRLRLFGGEPELAAEPGVSYELAPSDQRVGELFAEATVFVQTSSHEGFCLPLLEAMACGTPVVCTDAHGNRDFCRDGENCLLAAPTAPAVADAMRRLLVDPELRARLAAGGLETASRYRWTPRIEELESFFAAL
ncbi:MAG TPA: glycosyltransferase family 4 protein, partial [Solirubrobacteraceae bacterium]|nr:glycosyltransferase family 4 protein [Solirubrobacteraceae bacterium]